MKTLDLEAFTASIKATADSFKSFAAALKIETAKLKLETLQANAEHKALQNIAIAHGMSSDVRVIKGEVTNLVIGDAA